MMTNLEHYFKEVLEYGIRLAIRREDEKICMCQDDVKYENCAFDRNYCADDYCDWLFREYKESDTEVVEDAEE